jgi:hypothetical protein
MGKALYVMTRGIGFRVCCEPVRPVARVSRSHLAQTSTPDGMNVMECSSNPANALE